MHNGKNTSQFQFKEKYDGGRETAAARKRKATKKSNKQNRCEWRKKKLSCLLSFLFLRVVATFFVHKCIYKHALVRIILLSLSFFLPFIANKPYEILYICVPSIYSHLLTKLLWKCFQSHKIIRQIINRIVHTLMCVCARMRVFLVAFSARQIAKKKSNKTIM